MVYLLILFYWIIATYNIELFGNNFSTVYLMIFILISLVIMLRRRYAILQCPKSFLIFILICLVYSIQLKSFGGSLSIWLKVAIPFFLLLVMENIFRNELGKALHKLSVGIGISNWLACIVGIVRYFTGNTINYTAVIGGTRVLRMTGSFQQPNVFASYIAISLAFGLYAAFKVVKEKKWLMIVVGFLNAICLILSFSRWAIVSVIIAVALCFLTTHTHSQKIKRNTLYAVICILICTVVAVIFGSENILEQIQVFFIHEGSTEARNSSMINALKAVVDNVFLGIGIGNLPSSISILDSSILNILVNTGVFGFGIYSIFTVCLGHSLKREIYMNSNSNKLLSVLIYFSFLTFAINCIAESIVYNALINNFAAIYIYSVVYKKMAVKAVSNSFYET